MRQELYSRPIGRFALDRNAENEKDYSNAEKDCVHATTSKQREKRYDQGYERNAEEEHTPERCLFHTSLRFTRRRPKARRVSCADRDAMKYRT